VDPVERIKSRLEGFDWTQGVDAFDEVTHSIHKYPAKLIPQIPALFIREFCEEGSCVLDPYCGSGTTLLEAKRHGIDSIGFDLNPLAIMISKMKTTTIKIRITRKEVEDFKKSDFDNWQDERYQLDLPLDEALKYFPKKTICQINHFKNMIDDAKISEHTRSILILALSDILRKVSFTRMGDFKIYMIPKEERASFYVPPKEEFLNKIDDILRMLDELRKEMKLKKLNPTTEVLKFDSSSKKPIPAEIHGHDQITLVVTSPPYGDSRTTVAYGEFSWFSNRILGLYPQVKQGTVDKLLMGGRRIWSRIKPLGDLHKVLGKINSTRRKEVRNFFYEYQRSMEKVAKVLQPGGICCYVVANRNVDGQTIPMDEFTQLYFEHCGLLHVETYTRDIHNKTLARKNNKTSLMNKEIIVVMYKPQE